jgi:type II secretory pathway pseudopilin PulG
MAGDGVRWPQPALPTAGSQAGVTYLYVLLMIAVLGAGAAAVAEVWVTHSQREREAELLFVGEQYRKAIGAYFESTPGAARQYPRSLEDLLRDRRYPVVRRYLRRIYADPMTGSPDWGIVKAPDGGIAGVYSTSTREAFKQKNFRPEHESFEGATSYVEWKFTYAAGSAGTPGAGKPRPTGVGGKATGADAAAAPHFASPMRVRSSDRHCSAERDGQGDC